MSGVTKKLLNAFYDACSYAKADCSKFINVTVARALKLMLDKLQTQSVFLCIDDTMVSNSDKKFEYVSKLFGHVAHSGSNYLNGHCFVSLLLCVPVWNKGTIQCSEPEKEACLQRMGKSFPSMMILHCLMQKSVITILLCVVSLQIFLGNGKS